MEEFAKSPLPEHLAEDFVYFSFVPNGNEESFIQNVFLNPGKILKKMKSKSSLKKFEHFLRNQGFGRIFLFKFRKLIEVFINSGNGEFLGNLVISIFDRYKHSILKNEKKGRSIHDHGKKKIEIPENILQVVELFKEKIQMKSRAMQNSEANDLRVIGNHVIRDRIFKERILEEAAMFNHLEILVLNLQAQNLNVNYSYGVYSLAIDLLLLYLTKKHSKDAKFHGGFMEEQDQESSAEVLNFKFYKNYFMQNIFSECQRKIEQNLGVILNQELPDELWDFSSFYDRILEQRSIMKAKFKFDDLVDVMKQQISTFLLSDKKNFFKGLRVIEKLAGGSSKVRFEKIWDAGPPRFRTHGDGSENLIIEADKDKPEDIQMQQEKLGKIKTKLRQSIKAKQLGAVILFEKLEEHFPVQEYKNLFKAQKIIAIRRVLSLVDRLARSGLVGCRQKMAKHDLDLEKGLLYKQTQNKNDIEICIDKRDPIFGLAPNMNCKMNLTVSALMKRRLASVIDHSRLASLLDKLGSVDFDPLEYISLVFEKNGILQHQKSMAKCLGNLFFFVCAKNFDFKILRLIFQIFESKINSIRDKLSSIKSKYKNLFQLRTNYKSKKNRKRAAEVLESYRERFQKSVKFLRVVIGHKEYFAKTVFKSLYRKTFYKSKPLASEHMKMCFENEKILGEFAINSRRHHFFAAFPRLLKPKLGPCASFDSKFDDPQALLPKRSGQVQSLLGKRRTRAYLKADKSLVEIIYRRTDFGSLFDRLFSVMNEYLGREISMEHFGLLRFNPALSKVKQIFGLFIRSEDLLDFDFLFVKFAEKFDETTEYLSYFKSFLEAPFVQKCSDFGELGDEFKLFEKGIAEQPILRIDYPGRLKKIKQDHISLITSAIFLNVLDKLHRDGQCPPQRPPSEYLDFGCLSFLDIERLLRAASDYLERLFHYSRDSQFRRTLLVKDVRQIFRNIDVESELNLFRARYDAKLEGLFDLFGQSRFVRVSLEFVDCFRSVYDFYKLDNRESTEQLAEFKQFYLRRRENTVFWDLRTKYAKMRVFSPRQDAAEVPNLKTDLDLGQVNPLFLLIENHANVIYFLQVLSENIELAGFLMEIYESFLDSFESKIDILNEEIQAGDSSIKNFHLVDCKHLIRHLKDVSANNFASDHQLLTYILAKNITEGRVKDLVAPGRTGRAYPNYLRQVNSLSKNAIFKKHYGRHR